MADCVPPTLIWASGDRLLVLAERAILKDGATKKRMDWWLVTQSTAPRNLTESLKTVPGDLLPDPTRRNFVGVADDEIWRLDIGLGQWTNLTMTVEPKVSGIAWPTSP